MPQAREVSVFSVIAVDLMAGAVMTGEGELVGLLHRADWTRLSMSGRVSEGWTVLIAPGRRYRYQAGEYVTGCDAGRPWELPGEDVDEVEGSVHWVSGPEPPIRELLCPAWLLESSRLEVRGRVRACGRDALDVVATRRPSVRRRSVPAGMRSGPTEVLVDAELGFLLRVAEMVGAAQPQVIELVSADFDPIIDPAQFRPPLGSLIAASRLISAVRVAGPGRYQIDHAYQPRRGPKTIACDGQHLWQVYDDKITTGPAEPLPGDIADLADPSWLLGYRLSGGTPVMAGDRPAYRVNVARGHAKWSFSLMFPAAVAVVDAELGIVLRLTYYIGAKAVQRHELRGITSETGGFQVDLPAGLPTVEETGPFDDFKQARAPRPASIPLNLAGLVARHAAAEAARAARDLSRRVDTRGPHNDV